ncbi:hypothetical protein Isop_3222 [Isosphaera pallida ATCC 43644]|uniref:Uncharacterized protein n=1 Tax=Isosphaera pallida (strain ATCC 43644 / DSM 9630 / IS1B) TaxID=575540 RepID=E8R4I9_ISOPI|nr:hypothetical protein Isop_3222 [Isosphaera pallida ATCC 43644]
MTKDVHYVEKYSSSSGTVNYRPLDRKFQPITRDGSTPYPSRSVSYRAVYNIYQDQKPISQRFTRAKP